MFRRFICDWDTLRATAKAIPTCPYPRLIKRNPSDNVQLSLNYSRNIDPITFVFPEFLRTVPRR